MIVVKFELHAADGSGVRELGRLTITNVDGDNRIGDYEVMAEVKTQDIPFSRFGMFRVNGYERKQGFLRLIKQVLDRVVEELGYATEYKQS